MGCSTCLGLFGLVLLTMLYQPSVVFGNDKVEVDSLTGSFKMIQPPCHFTETNSAGDTSLLTWPCLNVKFKPGNFIKIDARRKLLSPRKVLITKVENGYLVPDSKSCIPVNLVRIPDNSGMELKNVGQNMAGIIWVFAFSGMSFESDEYIFTATKDNAELEFTTKGLILRGITTYEPLPKGVLNPLGYADALEYELPAVTVYRERDEWGGLSVPDNPVLFGDVGNRLRAKIRLFGNDKDSYAQYQDVLYEYDEEGKLKGRIAVYGYLGFPFEVQKDFERLAKFKLRRKTTIKVNKVEGSVFVVDEESAYPLVHTGSKYAVWGSAFPTNAEIVFLKKGISFETDTAHYTTKRKNASISFTEKGVVYKGIKVKKRKSTAKMPSDSAMENGLDKDLPVTLSVARIAEEIAELEVQLRKCNKHQQMVFKVEIRTTPNGTVRKINWFNKTRNTSFGKCAKKIIKRTRFPKAQEESKLVLRLEVVSPSSGNLSDLLGPRRGNKGKKSFTNHSNYEVPEKLTRHQVLAGMKAVYGSVEQCGNSQNGTITIKIHIAPTGRVAAAGATGKYAGTTEGLCAERAVRKAVFPRAQNPLTVTFPFRF